MARIVSQETFDDIVKENIIEFSMSLEEAKDETIKQFESQGVNLANIIKDLAINETTGRPILTEVLESLKKHISGENKLDKEQLKENLIILETECKKSIPHRVLAAKNGAHEILLSILDNELSKKNENSNDYDQKCLIHCLEAANALTNKQPDIFDAEALSLIIKILSTEKNSQILCLTLKWLQKACILHEMNRQNIVNADVIKYLKPLIHLKDGNILRNVCCVFRCLTLDDDIRVEYGNAHAHAKAIATVALTDLTKLLAEYEDDLNVLCDLLITIAPIVVRQELCAEVDNANGLELILGLMKKYPDAVKLNCNALKLLRALCGHDTLKARIVKEGAAPIICDLLECHKTNESTVAAALACVSFLTLRNKDNSLVFFQANLPQIIVDILKLHPKNDIIQRNAAWCIRNMTSRLREYCESFLCLGVEEILNTAMKDHPSVKDDIKTALRNLGCDVELKEEWTGQATKKIAN